MKTKKYITEVVFKQVKKGVFSLMRISIDEIDATEPDENTATSAYGNGFKGTETFSTEQDARRHLNIYGDKCSAVPLNQSLFF